MQRSLDLLALTKRLEMISTKPAVGRHFFRRFEFKGEKRRRSQAFYTGTFCLSQDGAAPRSWGRGHGAVSQITDMKQYILLEILVSNLLSFYMTRILLKDNSILLHMV